MGAEIETGYLRNEVQRSNSADCVVSLKSIVSSAVTVLPTARLPGTYKKTTHDIRYVTNDS